VGAVRLHDRIGGRDWGPGKRPQGVLPRSKNQDVGRRRGRGGGSAGHTSKVAAHKGKNRHDAKGDSQRCKISF